jgi:hypothetical protein
MKRLLIALICITLAGPVFGQSADDPATSDDVILLLRTMHSHDMFQRTMEAMLQPMRQMMHEQMAKQNDNDKDKQASDFESRMSKMIEDMYKNMPMDEMMQAMIPAYQRHFTHADIQALNAFYASAVGQKFLQETPAVTGESMQAMMPILMKYMQQWQERMKQEMKQQPAPDKTSENATPQS